MVLEVDTENKRISLGVKQLLPNPWDDIIDRYPVRRKVTGKIKSVVDFGIFVDLGEEVDALIHVSDVSWTRKNIELNKEFLVGNDIEAMVVSVDKENQNSVLDSKQLEEDPWKKIETRLPVGSVVEAEVVRVTDFGAFIELETGIEGLVHISELSEERVNSPSDVVKNGDKVKVMVISIDKDSKKIALSIKSVGTAEARSTADLTVESASSSTMAEKLKGFSVGTEK